MWSVDQILALFAPFECLQCGREGDLLCHACGFNAVALPPRRCYRCLSACTRAACPGCLPADLCDVWVATAYEGVASQLISRLKFARTQAAAPLIARLMDRRLPATATDLVVVYIPTANRRVRERGYDQAKLIAREFARYRRLPCANLLRRRGYTRQLGANKQQRAKQLQKAFYCPRPDQVKGRDILLVDDVLTTGSTVEAAARVLKRADANRVYAALFAQKL